MDIIKKLAEELDIGRHQAEVVVKLIDEGNTIPLIARYRKGVIGSLNDEVLRSLDEWLRHLRSLEERKAQVTASISEQRKLTPEPEFKIKETQTPAVVEDLYRLYKPKRRTRVTIAKEKGLEPLADTISLQMTKESLELVAAAYISEDKGMLSVADVIQGAKDILVECTSDNAEYRTYIRSAIMNKGVVQSAAKDEKAQSVYEMHCNYEEPVKKCAGHRILALNRGGDERVLTAKIATPEDQILTYLEKQTTVRDSPCTIPLLKGMVPDSYARLIGPSIEREIRSELMERAEEEATKVFGKNLEWLLIQPSIVGRMVLGWDLTFRIGCKLVVVDNTGKVLDTVAIYPTAPQNKVAEAKKILKDFIRKYNTSLISVGNGAASRELEQIIVDPLKEIKKQAQYVVVNEAGASVYSAGKLATEEFPAFDVGQRSAVSIIRRLQDPLSELVKIGPKPIGVGQYQYDMNQKHLGETLEGAMGDCVNEVGMDLNTVSASLLEYVSRINKTLAKNIVAYRKESGAFKNRKQLLKVAKLGPEAFEQCAGFMRIIGEENSLDGTSVHPESYGVAKKLLETLGYDLVELNQGGLKGISRKITDYRKMVERLEVGEITLRDTAGELEKPARDSRDEMPRSILRSDILEMKDLKSGMVLKGIVRNVIDFGAFVDTGAYQDGSVHISRMTDKYIKHPLEAVSVRDIVDMKIISVDLAKKRIVLTMRGI